MIVITPPALDAAAWKEYCRVQEKPYAPKTEDLTASYAEACLKTAKNEGVPTVDLHSAMLKQVIKNILILLL